MTPKELRAERDARGLSRVQFGKLIGMTSSQVARMETRGFRNDDEQTRVLNLLESLTVVDDALDETAEEDPLAWVFDAKSGDPVNVCVGTTWFTDRYRFARYVYNATHDHIDVVDQRNGALRSFPSGNVRPQSQTTG